MKNILYFFILLTTALCAQQLVVNPDFSELDEKGKPIGWKCDNSVRIIPDADGMNKAVILDVRNAGLSQTLELKPEYAHLKLDFWMKTTNVVQGDESWHTARLAMSFQDADGKQVGSWPRVFGWVGTSEWRHCIRQYIIPKGATKLNFSASLFAPSGLVEFKNIKFTVTANRLDKPANAPCPMHEEAAQSIEDAWTRTTPSRESISMNGLWQFRPVLSTTATADGKDTPKKAEDNVPADDDCWGWFKLPAIWPDRWDNDEAYQSPILAQYLEDNFLTKENAIPEKAWYKRTINVPSHWEDRQIVLDFSLVNTHAKVFVDNVKAGDVWFPGGEVDLTGKLLPGKRQSIAILVEAIPLADTMDAFMAPDRIIKDKAVVKNKGINGDVYLVSRPKAQRIAFVQDIPSVKNNTITFRTDLEDAANIPYRIVADVTLPDGSVKTFSQKLPTVPDENNAIVFTSKWKKAPLWELDDPQLLTASVSLYSADGLTLIDRTIPFTFGFREFEARGKDLYLNGVPIHLRALHCNAGTSIDVECSAEPEATEMLRRMRQYGFNFLINGHYNFNFGAMNYLEGLLRAAEKNGFLMSFSLPHLNQFGWKLHEIPVRNRYTWMTRFLIRKVANNPAVVMYAMNHNSCGYYGDQNPLKIDGKYRPEKDEDSEFPLPGNRRNQATHAEMIVKSLDPTRLVYHHESGNLGDLHSVNIYLNWAPLQERSDWMKHWAANGVKPVFFVEWGLPHISSWSSYRGPAFIWRTKAFQSLWGTEYAAAELGEDAYRQASIFGGDAIAHEQNLWDTKEPFAWSELNKPIAKYPFYHQIMAKYATDNWRSHRTFGVSAMLPWDQGALWKTPKNVNPKAHLNDLSILKQPGLFPDKMNAAPSQFIYGKTDPSNWEPTELGEAFLRWNQDTCAYIGGANEDSTIKLGDVAEDNRPNHVTSDNQMPQHFVTHKKTLPKIFTSVTDKTHYYRQGETIQKTIVLINDTRRTRVATVDWRCQSIRKSFTATLKPGTVTICPISCVVGDSGLQIHTFGSRIMMTAKFDNGDIWKDQFDFQTLPILDKLLEGISAWIYDPKGLTTQYLQDISMLELKPLAADATIDFAQIKEPIIIGREALDDPAHITWLAEAIQKGKVLFFEQSYDALTKRLGFRANIHGLRELFVTKDIHQAFRDCISPMEDDEERAANTALKNWRGASTLTPPFLDVPENETHNPKWNWLGFENTRVWRAGNQGNVASVLIEKPEIGNWRPLAVGGFDLQYAPLLELIVGKGRTIFCQLDVTNRTENDPVGDRIACRLIHYLAYAPETNMKRKVYYTGGPEGRALLTNLKIDFEDMKPFPDALQVDSVAVKPDLRQQLDYPSLRNDIVVVAHGAPSKILEQINLNAQDPKNILEKLDRADKVPAGLVAIGMDKSELKLAGLFTEVFTDFNIRKYDKLIMYLNKNKLVEDATELEYLVEENLLPLIEMKHPHIKGKITLAWLKGVVPNFSLQNTATFVKYLEDNKFKKDAAKINDFLTINIPNILEKAQRRLKEKGNPTPAKIAIASKLDIKNYEELIKLLEDNDLTRNAKDIVKLLEEDIPKIIVKIFPQYTGKFGLTALASEFVPGFDVKDLKSYSALVKYLDDNDFDKEAQELWKYLDDGIQKSIELARLRIKEKIILKGLKIDIEPELDMQKFRKIIIYLERMGFWKEAEELAKVQAQGIPSLLEEALLNVYKKTKATGMEDGTSLAFSVPLPPENHLEQKPPARKHSQAVKDYIKNLPDKDIAYTAFEIIRGLSSADIYWHAKLAKAAVALSPNDDLDKYVLSVPSLFALVHERRVTVCLQPAPWDFDNASKPYLRTSYRRSVFTVAKILANLGADFHNPIIDIVSNPPQEKAWLHSYYLQEPKAEDDPYRYYRW